MKMIKKGFTLTEVLVTLVVIGAVAALTIPSLVSNIGEQQNKVAWRKAFSDLSQAAMMVVADNGGSLVGAFSGDEAGSESLKNAFASKLNVVKNCSGNSANGGSGQGASVEGCWHRGANSWSYLNNIGLSIVSQPGLILNNGNLIRFSIIKSDCSSAIGDYLRCGWIVVDINGFGKPNVIGKDIFYVSVTANTLIPYGTRGYYDPSTNCIEGSTAAGNTGEGCATKYLYQ